MNYVDSVINKKPEDFKQQVIATIKDKISGYIDWRKNQITQEVFNK